MAVFKELKTETKNALAKIARSSNNTDDVAMTILIDALFHQVGNLEAFDYAIGFAALRVDQGEFEPLVMRKRR